MHRRAVRGHRLVTSEHLKPIARLVDPPNMDLTGRTGPLIGGYQKSVIGGYHVSMASPESQASPLGRMLGAAHLKRASARPKESIMDRPKLPRAARSRIASGKARPLLVDKNRILPLDL